MVAVYVVEGADRRLVSSDADPVTIGRDPDCHVYLPTDRTVSRLHASLVRRAGVLHVVDNDSRNGVEVNGQRRSEHPLVPGDRIRIGGYLLLVPETDEELAFTEDAPPSYSERDRIRTGLTPREIDVVRSVCRGLSDQEIAEEFFISVAVVHELLDGVRDKAGCGSRAEIVRWAMVNRLV